ncbi:hypothetical protein BY458DRAFT_499588 [Sporodiniella umbellata]|nr:hypothetical protein BY458DRAFT_499588 [Sporodiniella umbellata]
MLHSSDLEDANAVNSENAVRSADELNAKKGAVPERAEASDARLEPVVTENTANEIVTMAGGTSGGLATSESEARDGGNVAVGSTSSEVDAEEIARQQALLGQIAQKKAKIQQLNEELYYLRHSNAELAEKERGTQERMQLRQRDQQQLLNNYNEHIRSRRATEDDTHSIRQKLQELKTLIGQVSVGLTNECDVKTATAAIGTFWINLNEAIRQLGSPIPKRRLCMLTEKFLMDVLVQSMNYNTFPGLKISQPYTQLQSWFDQHDPDFCTRFRQEVAKTVVAGHQTALDIQTETQRFNKRMYNSLYSSLLKAYPHMEKHDAEATEPSRKYAHLIQRLVDQATHLGYAIRGQEVEIAAAAVGEGTEPLDPKTMNDEDGQSSGIIQFCVCPPFVVYGSRIEILEKARVLCFSK